MAGITEKITLDASQAIQELNKTKQATQNTAATIAKAGQQMSYGIGGIQSVALQAMNAMGPVGMAVAAGFMIATAGIAAAVKGTISFANKLDALAKQAKSVDMTVNGFLSLKHAVGLAGGDMQKIMNIVTRLEDAVVKANEGNKKYQQSFTDIGLSWLKMAELSPEEKIMAIVSAIRRLKTEGKDIPSSFTEQLVGRKGMQDINKLVADPSFERNVIGATLEGFGIDKGTIRQAEALNDAVSDVGDAFIAWVSNLKTVQWLMDNIKEVTKSITKHMAGTSEYRVDKKYANQAIGIGDVTDILLAKGAFTDEEKIDYLLKAHRAKYGTDHNAMKARMQYEKFLRKNPGQVDVKFAEQTRAGLENMTDEQRLALFYQTTKHDKRFTMERDSWIQLKNKGYDEANITSKDAVTQTIESIESIDVSKTKELLDITKQIEEVEASINDKLTEQQRHEIEIAAQKKNQLIYMQNAQSMQEKYIDKAKRKIDYESAKALSSNNGANEMKKKDVNASNIKAELFNVNKNDKNDKNAKNAKNKLPQKQAELLNVNKNDKNDKNAKNAKNRLPQKQDKFFNEKTLEKAERINSLKAEYGKEDPFVVLAKLREEKDKLREENNDDQDNLQLAKKVYGMWKENYDNANNDEERERIVPWLEDSQEHILKYKIKQKESDKKLQSKVQEVMRLENKLKGISSDDYYNLNNKIEGAVSAEQQRRREFNLQLDKVKTAREEMDLIERKNMLVEMGLKPTKENLELYKQQLDYMQKMAKAEQSVKLLTSIKQGQQDFRIDMLEATGRTRQATFERGRIEAEKTKGSYLTDEEKKLVDMKTNQGLLMDFIKNMKASEDVIKTNSLASRGGMVGSVYVEKNDNARKQIQLLGAIRTACELNNRIMTTTQTMLAGY